MRQTLQITMGVLLGFALMRGFDWARAPAPRRLPDPPPAPVCVTGASAVYCPGAAFPLRDLHGPAHCEGGLWLAPDDLTSKDWICICKGAHVDVP